MEFGNVVLRPHVASSPRRGASAGVSLVELMIALGVFAIMALSALIALVQVRKISDNNVAQVTAMMIAQGIIEQVHLNGYTTITTLSDLPLTFTGPTTANISRIQQFSLPWAADATTFTEVGTRSDPTDPTSPMLGVLLDLEYRSGATVIRPAKYMRMRVNLQRTIHLTDDNIEVILTYSWQPPTGNGAATSRYITRELRTVRSPAQSY